MAPSWTDKLPFQHGLSIWNQVVIYDPVKKTRVRQQPTHLLSNQIKSFLCRQLKSKTTINTLFISSEIQTEYNARANIYLTPVCLRINLIKPKRYVNNLILLSNDCCLAFCSCLEFESLADLTSDGLLTVVTIWLSILVGGSKILLIIPPNSLWK